LCELFATILTILSVQISGVGFVAPNFHFLSRFQLISKG